MSKPRLRSLCVDLITNQGPNTLDALLTDELRTAVRADFAVAFTTDAGLDPLYAGLERVASVGRVRFMTGTYQGVTEPAALHALLDIQRRSKRLLAAKLSGQPKFHWKLYLLYFRGRRVTAVVGSSNLTNEGLTSTGETCVVLRGDERDGALKRLALHFESEWTSVSGVFTDEQIAEYERQRGDGPPRGPRITLGQIRKRGQPEGAPMKAGRYWRDFLDGAASPATQTYLSSETNWDAQGWQWFTSHTPEYERGDRVVLFDFPMKWASAVEIKASTPLPYSSHRRDGKYAFAFLRVRGIPRRRIRKRLWTVLKDARLIPTKATAYRRVRMRFGRWRRFARALETMT